MEQALYPADKMKAMSKQELGNYSMTSEALHDAVAHLRRATAFRGDTFAWAFRLRFNVPDVRLRTIHTCVDRVFSKKKVFFAFTLRMLLCILAARLNQTHIFRIIERGHFAANFSLSCLALRTRFVCDLFVFAQSSSTSEPCVYPLPCFSGTFHDTFAALLNIHFFRFVIVLRCH